MIVKHKLRFCSVFQKPIAFLIQKSLIKYLVAHAAKSLHFIFLKGRGVALDDEAAMRHYRAAADMGHPQGQCNLAVLYEHGRGGLAPSEVMAAPLFRVAADGGDGDAMFNLGVYYEQGRGGLPKSREEAAMWYRKAAAVGDGFGDAK